MTADTRDRLADHKLAHTTSAWAAGGHPPHVCALDRQPWPCDSALLFRELAALTAERDALRTAAQSIVDWADDPTPRIRPLAFRTLRERIVLLRAALAGTTPDQERGAEPK